MVTLQVRRNSAHFTPQPDQISVSNPQNDVCVTNAVVP